MLRSKKNSNKELDNKKKLLRLENSPRPRPNNFSNGPSLIDVISFSRCASSCSLYLFPFSFGSSPVL